MDVEVECYKILSVDFRYASNISVECYIFLSLDFWLATNIQVECYENFSGDNNLLQIFQLDATDF